MACCGLCGSISRKPSLISFPDIGGVAGEYPNKSWMEDLVGREKGKSTDTKATLKRMVIPGSHDSASYSISRMKPGSAIGKTQSLTTMEQLLSGVRLLDLRIASGKGGDGTSGVNIFHGVLMGCPFEEVLGEIRQFCNDCPKEFVILHVQAEYGRPFSAEHKAVALELMKSHFGSLSEQNGKRLLCKLNSQEDLMDTPLEKLIHQNGRVCVFLLNRIYKDFVVKGVHYNADFVKNEYGFFDSYWWLKSKWHDTMDTIKLVESNLQEVRKTNTKRHLVNSQFVLTPAFKASNIGGYITRQSSIQPVRLANEGLYMPPKGTKGRGIPILHDCFLEHPEEDWNIVSLDFVDLAPAALQLLIGMNFGPLEIEIALLKNGSRGTVEDVTDLVRSKILRKSCMCLHPKHEFDPGDLGGPGSTLTLVYTISGTLYAVVVRLSEIDVLVLDQQNHLLAGGTELVIGEGKERNGIIDLSRTDVTVTWQKTGQYNFQFGYLDQDNTPKLVDS